MSRKKSNEPKLFRRGRNGDYYFRRLVKGKDTKINTKTSDIAKAREFRNNYIRSETTASVLICQGTAAIKAADTVIKTITGAGLRRITFEEAYSLYIEHTPEWTDLSEQYSKDCQRSLEKFQWWCNEKEIHYLDEITKATAMEYSTFLYSSCSPATHDLRVKFLSKFFATIDAIEDLPNRNPFNNKTVRRKRKGLVSEGSHRALEPAMVSAVMKEAAKSGQDWLDLFIVGYQTGMRLEDASLFRWDWIHGDFIDFEPKKTKRSHNHVRIPISIELKRLLERKRKENISSPYVNPVIADFMGRSDWVYKHSQEIFQDALGKDITQIPKGPHRKRNTCVYGFHSFRTTFMSMLATKLVHYRDAMKMLGWSSIEMVQLYEKMLEQARGEQDNRNKLLIDSLTVLQTPLEGVTVAPPVLKPTKDALEKLYGLYSNIVIGKIYEISDVAVAKWAKKYGINRTDRIISDKVTEEEIRKVREELRKAA